MAKQDYRLEKAFVDVKGGRFEVAGLLLMRFADNAIHPGVVLVAPDGSQKVVPIGEFGYELVHLPRDYEFSTEKVPPSSTAAP